MDFFEAIAVVEKAYPHIDPDEIRSAMNTEVLYEESRLTGRDKYRRAVENSKDRILEWLKTGYRDFSDPADSLERLIKFVAGRRASYTWAVLRSFQMNRDGECECMNCAVCGGKLTICGRCRMCTVCHEHARGCPKCHGKPRPE